MTKMMNKGMDFDTPLNFDTGPLKKQDVQVLSAFFESIKYVGHLFPVAFLRVFVGYFFLNQALMKYHGDFLVQPRLAEWASQSLTNTPHQDWVIQFFQMAVIPEWKFFAVTIVTIEFLIGISYLLGYLVRPISVLGLILCTLMLTIQPESEVMLKLFIAVHFTLAWMGAGRCLGLDYYFYKRHRGIWW